MLHDLFSKVELRVTYSKGSWLGVEPATTTIRIVASVYGAHASFVDQYAPHTLPAQKGRVSLSLVSRKRKQKRINEVIKG